MRELCIFEGIGADPETGEGMTAKVFDARLKALGNTGSIVVRINSPGGDVFEAMAIYTMMKTSKATVTVRIEGIAASAASLIAMAADRIEIAENAFMLIHEPWTQTSGSAGELASAVEDLERMTATYARIYSQRSGQPLVKVLELMKEDRLMSAGETVTLGYCDAISVESDCAPNMSALPKRYRAAIRAARVQKNHGWDKAIALATGQRSPRMRRNSTVDEGWDRAIRESASAPPRRTDASASWDAARRRVFGNTR